MWCWPGARGNPRRQVDQLSAFGIKVVWIDATRVSEVVANLRQLKNWSPDPAKANAAADSLLQQQQTLSRRYAGLPKKKVFLQFGQHPLFTASGRTVQNEILQLCGGENIFADSRVAWPQVSREQVLMRKPDVIVTGGEATPAEVENFWRPQFTVPVIIVNDDWFSRPGPRIMLAAQQLCSQLHPEQKP